MEKGGGGQVVRVVVLWRGWVREREKDGGGDGMLVVVGIRAMLIRRVPDEGAVEGRSIANVIY